MSKHVKAKHHFTPEQIKFLEKNVVGNSFGDLTVIFNRHFGTNLLERQIHFCCHRNKLKNGRYAGFIPGVPRKIRPVGSEVVLDKKKQVTYIKISDDGKTFGMCGTWKRKHVHIWEQVNGKIPKRHKVIFADGDKSNFVIENLLCVHDNVFNYMLRYGFIYTDPEMTKTVVAIATFAQKIKERQKNQENYQKGKQC